MKITFAAFCLVLLIAMHATAQVDPPAVSRAAAEPGFMPAATAPATPSAMIPTPPVTPPGPPGMPPGPPVTPPGPPGMPGMPPAVPVRPAPTGPSGDEITLKSGTVLKGVQVLRRSPVGVEVQVTEGVKFLIPRKQVVEIKYDDVEPLKQRRVPQTVEPKQAATFFGAKIEPGMSEKLNMPLPESCLKSGNRDLVEIMTQISTETGVKIDVTDAVKKLAPEERKWDFSLEPGTTLTALLQSSLPERFTNLAIVYEYERLVITTREDAAAGQVNVEGASEAAPAVGTPEAPPAPAAPEAAAAGATE